MKNNTLTSLILIAFLLTGLLFHQAAFANEETSTSQPPPDKPTNVDMPENNHKDDCLSTCDTIEGETEHEKENITLCHKSGSDLETLHVSFSAWKNHQLHGDYLGSCHKEKREEEYIVIKGCKGEYRKKLLTLAYSYFDPIIIHNDAYDDEETVVALSECLDHGDSNDDSDKSKGSGYDHVPDTGNYHRISGCNNKGSGKKYRTLLQQKIHTFNTTHKSINRSINLPDSSMDDSDVYAEYEKCASASNSAGTGKGDLGYKYREMNNCSNATEIKAKIDAFQEKVVSYTSGNKYAHRPIIVKSTALQDVSIKSAVKDCTHPLNGGGTLFKTKKTKGYLGRLNWKEKSTY